MNKLKEILEQNKEEYIQKLAELVAIDTHDIAHGIGGGLEKAGQEYMIRLFQNMNASKIETDDMKESVIEACLRKYQEGNLGHDQTDRFNVYATFAGKKGGKSLLFNSHIDVMPARKEDGWTCDPYKPHIVGDKMYGRGTADMKAGLMASTMAVKLLQDAGYELPGDVIITSVCDEEGGGNGSMQAVMSGLKADGVINCEGTSDELILAHMGWVFFKVDFVGRPCHSGTKKSGVSAIDKAIKVIQALNEKEHEWLLQYKHPLLPAPNLNIGVIQGGTAGSTVPGECSFSTCVHFIPNQMSHDQVVAEFTDVVNRVAKSDPWLEKHPPVISMYQAGNGFEMDAENSFVTTFCDAYQDAMEKKVKIVGSPSGCDSRLWRNIADCPTIQFGPGNLSECHGVDEWVSLESYLQSILIYAETILKWGGFQA
ncbi:MAG: ArgE/DapE family deacylase [Lachnospiraceae bacterium]|nr:ArgE/DapE family deacylase [Lachnospiraceae bacterium]